MKSKIIRREIHIEKAGITMLIRLLCGKFLVLPFDGYHGGYYNLLVLYQQKEPKLSSLIGKVFFNLMIIDFLMRL